MPIRAYCRIPHAKSNATRAEEGSCPELIYDLFNELRGATEIHIAAYLFNNPIYYNFLSDQVDNGCRVQITSLPISGYNDKPVRVKGYADKVSGRQLAQETYNKIITKPNMVLKIFPHLYVWYGALYVGGGPSYSFHVKAVYAKFPKGHNKCILSSGNFMTTDPFHSDNIIVFEDMQNYEIPFKNFFADLEKHSVPYSDFIKDFAQYEKQFLYSFVGNEIIVSQKQSENCFFSAPFYFYGTVGSNHYAGNKIIELIESAEKKIWICAQHFHDLISFDPSRETIVGALYKKFLSNPYIEILLLKQVPHSSLADKRRAGIAETLFQFVMKVDQRFNNLAHDKFMVIDNKLLVSTANYTPTQFAFGKRKMVLGKGENKLVKEDYFSEVNGFAIIDNCPKNILDAYSNHFETLWEQAQQIQITL